MHYKPPDILNLKQLPGQCLTMLVGTFPPKRTGLSRSAVKKRNRNAAHLPRRIAVLALLLFPLCPGREVTVQFAPQRFGSRAASRVPRSTRIGEAPLPAEAVLPASLLIAAVLAQQARQCAESITQASRWSFGSQSHVSARPVRSRLDYLHSCFTQSGRSLYAFRHSLQTQ